MQRSKEELSQCKLDRYEDNIKDCLTGFKIKRSG